jgi:hypothetical protein
VDPDEEEKRLARSAEEELPLFGVLGLRRVRGGSQTGMGSTLVRKDEKPTTVVMSPQVRFLSDDGASISVTSHRGDDDERFARTRSWAPINPYLSTQRGQVAGATWDRSVPGPPRGQLWRGRRQSGRASSPTPDAGQHPLGCGGLLPPRGTGEPTGLRPDAVSARYPQLVRRAPM